MGTTAVHPPSCMPWADGTCPRIPSVEVRTGDVVSWERADGGFILELADGRRESARRVVLATGMDYRRPELPGLTELWGRSVFHCPFCHGWEVRDEPLAVLASGDLAVHKALLLRGWSDDVVLLTDGPSDLAADDRARLAAAGIAVDERRVAELIASNGELAEIVFDDGGRIARRGLLVASRRCITGRRWPSNSARRTTRRSIRRGRRQRRNASGRRGHCGRLTGRRPQLCTAWWQTTTHCRHNHGGRHVTV